MKAILKTGLVAVVLLAAAAPVRGQGWAPPLGIPMPPFGIFEQPGPFTHYVDNTHPLATDTNNPNGSPSLPRRTVPTSLAAGSRVEVHGGPYTVSSSLTWTGNGTFANPVFVYGVGSPRFTGTPPVDSNDELKLAGSHFIVQSLLFDAAHVRMMDGTRLVFRFNEVRNYSPSSNSSAVNPAGAENVIYGNWIHHNGNPLSPVEIDIHGVAPDSGDSRIWIVDNTIHDNGGDSIQVGGATAPEPWARFMYIGRNVMHDDGENAVDIKRARDVIISQNTIFGYVPPPSGTDDGTAIVVHDNPDRVWVIFNRVSDSTNGIRCTGAQDGFYAIGNVVWNIRHDPGDPSYDPDSMTGVQGIRANATPIFAAVNNTVFGSDAGISYPNGNQGEIVNNVVAGLTQVSHHFAVGSASGNVLRNNVLDATARIRFGGSTVRNCQQTMSAFPGQVSQCINANPLLVNPGAQDFHILPSSPAVNTGLNGQGAYARFLSLYGIDIARDPDGMGRPVGPAFDIGTYELQPSVSVLDTSQPEGHFPTITHAVPLSLNGSSPLPIQVGFAVAAGTATAGVDFVAATGTVTIPPFNTTYSIPVTILPDLMDENNETYTVSLTSATNATLGDAQGIGTIADDDPQPELVVIDCGVIEGDSGSTACRFGVALSAASSFPVTVNYATLSGSAVSGQDFTAASGTLTFPPGTFAPQNVDVQVMGDGMIEADEGFSLNLTGATNATAPDLGVSLIVDDDAPALSTNELLHGWSQMGDLAATGAPDVDYYRLAQRAYTSWEVVADEVSGDVAPGLVLERLASDNSTVLQSAQPVGTGPARSLRWEHPSAVDALHQTLRVRSTGCTTGCDADDLYRLRVYETTMTLPRFNNTANSATVIIVQNRNAFAVNATLWFWGGSGSLVYSRAFTVPARGVFTLSPASAVPLLGLAGSVTMTSNAPYGTLSAKAATVDQGGGFSFDAPFELKPK
jgi:Calx-beta domain